MKILSAEESVSVLVETDDKESPFFRRHSADNWEQLMGQSWEPIYFRESELEEMYQSYLREKK